MCGRYTLHHTPGQIAMRFDVGGEPPETRARYNVAPTQPVAVVTQEAGGRALDLYRWGLIPSWAKDPAVGSRMINARAETVAEKPAFRHALKRRRCLVPSDGFYEWRAEDGKKQPYHFRRRDGELFAFAGLWEEWEGPGGGPLRSCAVITVGPNEVMLPVHDRMPALLLPDDEAAWLDPDAGPADVLPLLRPYPVDLMEAFPVDRRVNRPGLDEPGLINSL